MLDAQFLNDNTLRCAFPRIHAPTDDMLIDIKKKKQKQLCDQYESMLKEKQERIKAENIKDKEQIMANVKLDEEEMRKRA